MDSLRIRGKDTFDYKKWDEVLAKKALTYNDIHNVVTKGISQESSKVDLESAKFIIDDLKINALAKSKLLREVNSYCLRILSPSLAMLDVQKSIQGVINNNRNELKNPITYEVLLELKEQLLKDIIDLFETDRALISAIIYEIILSDI